MSNKNDDRETLDFLNTDNYAVSERVQGIIDILEVIEASKATRYMMVLHERPLPVMDVYRSQKNPAQARERLDLLEKYDLLVYSTYGKKTMVGLTAQGKDVADHLAEIGRILGESKNQQ